MLKSIGNFVSFFLSDRFSNKKAISDNILLKLMYRFAYPISQILIRFRLTPNNVTSISLALSFISLLCLSIFKSYQLFFVTWLMAIILDFCDGTIARMTGKISRSYFRFDHMSDLIKIYFVFLGIALYMNSIVIWCLALTSLFLFLYSDILNFQNDQISHYLNGTSSNIKNLTYAYNIKLMIINFIKSHELIYSFVVNVYTILFSVNGHTLLFFLFIPLSHNIAIGIFVYLIVICLKAIIHNTRNLVINHH